MSVMAKQRNTRLTRLDSGLWVPYWHSPRAPLSQRYATADVVQFDSSGHVLFTADGKVSFGCGGCQCDPVPTSWDVWFTANPGTKWNLVTVDDCKWYFEYDNRPTQFFSWTITIESNALKFEYYGLLPAYCSTTITLSNPAACCSVDQDFSFPCLTTIFNMHMKANC